MIQTHASIYYGRIVYKKHIRNNCSDPCLRQCSAICADTHLVMIDASLGTVVLVSLTIFFEIRIIL